ncbi:MAG: ATP-binding cassette domain-containing protein [Lentisphaerales bacterium]|nr:ATP-binding cassette domain-containing protein [Lentisphaerales bacterium]
MSEVEETVIEAVGLSKVFKDFWGRPKAKAVNGIDFKVKKGEVFGLLGPNGSGKSTTIKMLLGLLYPTRGALQIFNKSPRDVKTKQRIGYLPEETYLYKYLSAGETIDFFGSLFQLSGLEKKKRTEQLLDMVGLKNVGKRSVGEFSKGMARRVGLAQALVNDPDLIILDEPTSGLAPVACKEVKNLIKTLAERGKTVILSSHLLADVEDVVDRVVVLYGGQIRAEGTTDELLLVEDKTTITTPKMSKDVLEKVLKILHEEYSSEDMEITHPRLDLESFFLDVVNRARSESIHTAGAETGQVAEYLRSSSDSAVKEMAAQINVTDSEEEKARLQEKLEEKEASAKLAAIVQESEEKPQMESVDEKEALSEEAVAENSEKLEALVDQIKEPVKQAEPEVEKKSEEDLSKANDKLKQLLGGDD